MGSSVHVNQALLITPSQPTPNHILHLSALDSQLFVRFTFEYLLIFIPRRQIDRPLILHNLKSALGWALVPYYPLAGRVRARADGQGLEVVCRAQGAVFIDAVSTLTVSEFDGPPRRRAHWRNLLSLHVVDVLQGAPPLVVQLTWLEGGAAALAFGFNHCLCDGIGAAEFLNSFAELALGKRRVSELNPKPTWSRHLMKPVASSHDGNSLSRHPEFGSVPDVSGFGARLSRERLIPTSVVFDRDRLNELKKLTHHHHCRRRHHTSFEVVAAHVWRSWVRALNLASNQIVKLVFSVNVRDRVRPSLPSGYYGNAFVLGCARASVDSVGVLIMTQWSRLGLESVDFGMGRPVQVGPVCCDKYCIVLPVCGVADAFKVNLAVPLTAFNQYLYFLRNIYV